MIEVSDNWKGMSPEARIEAIKSVHMTGMTLAGAAMRIPGCTRGALQGFCERNRNALKDFRFGGPARMVLTDDEVKKAYEMFAQGRSVIEIADTLVVSYREVMRRLSQPVPRRHGPLRFAREAYSYRIMDYPDSLTAALCGDPTPMRRQLMREGRI